jgi:hypothetical protein
VAIDGTKELANASKHSAVSNGHAEKRLKELDEQIGQLLSKAEQADAVPLQDGLRISGEVARWKERKALLLKAKSEMEARAYARFQAEQAGHEAALAKREGQRAAGERPRGRESQAPDPKPGEKDQVNFTDEESRIMKTQDGFQQAYNAQAGVDTASRLIVGNRVRQATNDKQELVADLAEVRRHVTPAIVLVDSGFTSKAAVKAVEHDELGQRTGVTILAAVQREAHGRTVAQLEEHAEPPEPGPQATFTERLRH